MKERGIIRILHMSQKFPKLKLYCSHQVWNIAATLQRLVAKVELDILATVWGTPGIMYTN